MNINNHSTHHHTISNNNNVSANAISNNRRLHEFSVVWVSSKKVCVCRLNILALSTTTTITKVSCSCPSVDQGEGLLEESEGAKVVYLEGFESRDGTSQPLLVKKSDGGFM